MGAKGKPFYRLVVKEKRSKRDGKYLENVGTYDPMASPADVKLNHERIQYWIGVGAQPTETVKSLIKHNPVQTEEERAGSLAARAEAKAAAEAARAEAKKAEAEKLASERAAAEQAAAEKAAAEAAETAAAEAEVSEPVAETTEVEAAAPKAEAVEPPAEIAEVEAAAPEAEVAAEELVAEEVATVTEETPEAEA